MIGVILSRLDFFGAPRDDALRKSNERGLKSFRDESRGIGTKTFENFTERGGFLAKGGQRLTFFCFFSLVKQRKEQIVILGEISLRDPSADGLKQVQDDSLFARFFILLSLLHYIYFLA